jgi:DNA replication protein DnaC
MKTMEMTEPTMAETYCMDCGGVFEYESILFGRVDIGLALAKWCPACASKRQEAERAEARARAAEVNRARVLAILEPELLPVWLDPLGTDPEHLDFNRAKWEAVRRWRPGPHGNGLGLIGAAGTCKTRILGLLAEKILMQGIRLVWTSAMRLHTEAAINLRSHDKKLMQVAREHFQDCMMASYLVIDDLGNNEWCPAFESQLFTILDHRKNNRLPTLWSANARPESFHLKITSVNPAALIGRLLDGTNTLEFDEIQLF